MAGISTLLSERAMKNDELTLCGAPLVEPSLVSESEFSMSKSFILLSLLLCVLSMFVVWLIHLFFYSFV